MKLILGLGNPGVAYEKTRHNVGKRTVETLAATLSVRLTLAASCHALVGRQTATVLAVPTTFMNQSGQAVAALLSWFKLEPADLVVVHDDLDVPLGEVRVRFGGGTAGHNGIASIADQLGSPVFWRVRIGVGPHEPVLVAQRTVDTSGFVLSPFHSTEQPVVEAVLALVHSYFTPIKPWEETTLRVGSDQTTEKGLHGQA
jgi:PTH1 family peptidyl-tRNA hydrolase